MYTDLKLLTDAKLRTDVLTVLLRLEAESELEQFASDVWYQTAMGLPDAPRTEGATLLRRRTAKGVTQSAFAVAVDDIYDVAERERVATEALAKREAEVVKRMRALYDHYVAVSAAQPFNPLNPAIPKSLRKFAQAAKDAKLLDNATIRVIVYLAQREAILHAYNNGTLPEVEQVVTSTLEQVGMPRTKREERWEHILNSQFIHANGDRRTDREVDLSDDPDKQSDYNGLPTLAALIVAPPTICRECGTTRIDGSLQVAVNTETGAEFIVPRGVKVDDTQHVGFVYGVQCECDSVTLQYGTDTKTWYSKRALEAHVRRCKLQELQQTQRQRERTLARDEAARAAALRSLVVPPSQLKDSRSEEELADIARAERKLREAAADAELEAKLQKSQGRRRRAAQAA